MRGELSFMCLQNRSWGCTITTLESYKGVEESSREGHSGDDERGLSCTEADPLEVERQKGQQTSRRCKNSA